MLDEEEWRWAEAHLSGDIDDLHVVSTLPVLLPLTLHYVEAWNEAVCDGAWGKLAARVGEKVRRAIDLEHWAAFQDSFHRLVRTLEELASCRRGRPPASIVLLGGDIHQAYVAKVAVPRRGRREKPRLPGGLLPVPAPTLKRERTAFRVRTTFTSTALAHPADGALRRRAAPPDAAGGSVANAPSLLEPRAHVAAVAREQLRRAATWAARRSPGWERQAQLLALAWGDAGGRCGLSDLADGL